MCTPDCVSLFVRLWVEMTLPRLMANETRCQPLREAVSWNAFRANSFPSVGQSASSWGCELKYHFHKTLRLPRTSASSWGCELKYEWIGRPCTFCYVSLFVRLWVEINRGRKGIIITMSASSWGCELKYYSHQVFLCVILSASSWGCELKCNYPVLL